MRLWTAVWLLVSAVLGVFVVLNWQVLTAQTAVNLVVARVTAPLGLVMLGAMIVLALLCLAFIVWLETRTLLELGRAGRSATAADRDALAELRAHLDRGVGELKTQAGASMDGLSARLDRVEQVVKDMSQRVSHGGVV